MLNNDLIGDAHLRVPFQIGQIDSAKGYVHVFDDTTLNIVMNALDTITDFTAYLTKKEQFLTGERVIFAAGEEELLASYFRKLNDAGEHDFEIKGGDSKALLFGEGLWEAFRNNPARQGQIEADRISYAWDALIEKFAFHAMTGSQYFTSGKPLREQEIIFRFLAREPRTQQRLLATSLHDVLERSVYSSRNLEARVLHPIDPKSPHYAFLFLKRPADSTEEEYRNYRMNLLSGYCRVTKLMFPDATNIIGIASEAGLPPDRSEDLMYLDASRWSPEDEAEAKKIQNQYQILQKVRSVEVYSRQYPVDQKGQPCQKTPSRNSPCPCGSGKRFKRCHGKGLL